MINYLEYLYEKEECDICFEEKVLYKFCDNHKFCNNCCKDWIKNTFFCPTCRGICTNKKYFNYNISIINNEDSNLTTKNILYYFKYWHKSLCKRNYHKFIIKENDNNLEIYCQDCNVVQNIRKIFILP